MIYIYGIGSTILGLLLINIISKARDKKVSRQVSDGELVQLQLNQINEEDLRSKYSSRWLNLLALLPLPLILGGIIVIIYNLWQIDILWVKIVLAYIFIGLLIATNHVKNVGIGASGIGVTFLFVTVGWPIALGSYLYQYIWNKRIGR